MLSAYAVCHDGGMGPHRLVAVARDAIRGHLEGGERRAGRRPTGPVPWGVFVSLHGKPGPGEVEGPLRGCIGNLNLPSNIDLDEEVGRVAVSSATSDPRFPPLASTEADDLDITVYLLDPPEPVSGVEDLDPVRYGVIVTGPGERRGLLLPEIPGIDSPELQLELATRKAGLRPGSKVAIERFTATILR